MIVKFKLESLTRIYCFKFQYSNHSTILFYPPLLFLKGGGDKIQPGNKILKDIFFINFLQHLIKIFSYTEMY